MKLINVSYIFFFVFETNFVGYLQRVRLYSSVQNQFPQLQATTNHLENAICNIHELIISTRSVRCGNNYSSVHSLVGVLNTVYHLKWSKLIINEANKSNLTMTEFEKYRIIQSFYQIVISLNESIVEIQSTIGIFTVKSGALYLLWKNVHSSNVK